MEVHGRTPRLHFVRMTYLARVRIARARARWRASSAAGSQPVHDPRIDAPMGSIGLAEVIALAASGKARLEVATVGVTLDTAPAMQRWVALEASPADRLPTLAVIVQGPRQSAEE